MEAMFGEMGIVHHHNVGRINRWILIQIDPVVHDSNGSCSVERSNGRVPDVLATSFHIGDWQIQGLCLGCHLASKRLVGRQNCDLKILLEPRMADQKCN